MHPRSFLILLVVTLATSLAAAGLYVLNPDSRVTSGEERPALPLLAERRVAPATIEIADAEGRFQIDWRDDSGSWVLPSKDGYPADQDSVGRLLAQLAELKLYEPLTADPERLHRLSLEPLGQPGSQARRVTVLAADGSLLGDIVIGASTTRLVGDSEGGTYIRIGDDPQTWLAAGRLELPDGITGFMDRRITTLPDDTIRRVVITHPDGAVILAERKKGEPLLLVKTGLPEGTPPDPAKLRRLAQLLQLLSFEDVAAASEVSFPDDVVHTDVTSFDGIEVRMTLAEVDGAYWMRLSSNLAEEHTEVPDHLQGAKDFVAKLDAKAEGWAYRLSQAAFDRLTVQPAALTAQ